MTRGRAPHRPLALFWREVRLRSLVLAVSVLALVHLGVAAFEATGAGAILKQARQLLQSPALRALEGYPWGVTTPGGYTAWKEGGYIGLVAAIVLALTATRLARASEDDGSFDWLAVGRRDRRLLVVDQLAVLGLMAALGGLGTFLGFYAHGWAVGPSAQFGLAVGLVGLTGAGLGLLCSQLLAPRRSASLVAVSGLEGLYIVRMMADGTGLRWLDWLSPFGWLELVRAFAGPDEAPFIPLVVVPGALLGLAVLASRRRDVGSGLVQRTDSARARTALLAGPLAFAWRQRLAVLVAWAVAALVIGALLAALTHDIVHFISLNPSYRTLLVKWGFAEIATAKGFVAWLDLFLTLAVGLLAVTLLHGEVADELEGRLDAALASGVSRLRWSASVFLVSAAVCAVVGLAGGLGTYLGAALVHGGLPLGSALAGALNALSIVVPVLGIGLLLVGLAPRAAVATTTILVVGAFADDLFGSALRWPRAVVDASPFHQLAAVPAVGADWTPILVLVAVGLGTGAIGLWRLARRDLRAA